VPFDRFPWKLALGRTCYETQGPTERSSGRVLAPVAVARESTSPACRWDRHVLAFANGPTDFPACLFFADPVKNRLGVFRNERKL